MVTQNNTIIITKKTMDSYATLHFDGYAIGYYLQKDPRKEICEDALLIKAEDKKILLSVCDGVGGSDRSYRAAKNALLDLSEISLNVDTDDLYYKFLDINNRLLSLDGNPQTTITLVIIDTKKLNYRCWQAGDSGLIHCSNHDTVKYRSISHSLVGQELAAGIITEQEALVHPDLHVVTNVLGSEDFYIDCSDEQGLLQNDTLLLTSDGLLDNLLTDELISYVSKGDINTACVNLYDSAVTFKNINNNKAFNKVDDISFICLKSC